MAEAEIEASFTAVRRGDMEEVARLLDANPHLIEARDPSNFELTPLMTAAAEGHVGVMRLLLERGAEVNADCKYHETALHYAAENGHEEVVSILLSCGADPSRKDNILRNTPLMYASRNGHLGAARQLLQVRECGLDEGNNDGCTALWGACLMGHVEILRALLLAGADHSIDEDGGWTPRQIAEEHGQTECVALLEVSGAWILLVR
jgi:ankyrin repeat protein